MTLTIILAALSLVLFLGAVGLFVWGLCRIAAESDRDIARARHMDRARREWEREQ